MEEIQAHSSSDLNDAMQKKSPWKLDSFPQYFWHISYLLQHFEIECSNWLSFFS